MPIADTSIAAYDDLKATGKLTNQQKIVMAVILPGRDYTLQELVVLTGLPVNCVSGRVNELKKAPLYRLEECDKRHCTIYTKSRVKPVRLPVSMPLAMPRVQTPLFAEMAMA